jgi:thiosulfate reductase/polysulfide reductase chain A
METYGPKTVLFSDRGGPLRDLHQAFVRGLGSPNYSNHDSACARNVKHAARCGPHTVAEEELRW